MKGEAIGVDIDLRRCHAWSNQRGRLLYNAGLNDVLSEITSGSGTYLLECASPIIYNLTPSMLHNKLRWMIYNSFVIGHVASLVHGARVLISPSSTWKHGYKEKELHSTLEIEGDNHDIRECRAMVAMYAMHPEDWVPISEYVEKI